MKSPTVWVIVALGRVLSPASGWTFGRNLLRTRRGNYLGSRRNDDDRAWLGLARTNIRLWLFRRNGRADHIRLRNRYRLIGSMSRRHGLLFLHHANKSFSRQMGRSRTRTPVAWKVPSARSHTISILGSGSIGPRAAARTTYELLLSSERTAASSAVRSAKLRGPVSSTTSSTNAPPR
jgi:hypothetical protein